MTLKSILAAFVALFLAAVLHAQSTVALPEPPPAPAPEPENVLMLDLSTGGRVAIQLRPDIAPRHVERIKTLVREHFYDGIIFHRVIDGFMAQTGDPTGTGEGGSKLPNLDAEFSRAPHLRGTVSMARTAEPNTANSQFFIMFAPRFSLDGKYSVFGRVISGMEYVDAIERGEPPTNPSRILRASIAADNVPPPALDSIVPGAPQPSVEMPPAASEPQVEPAPAPTQAQPEGAPPS